VAEPLVLHLKGSEQGFKIVCFTPLVDFGLGFHVV